MRQGSLRNSVKLLEMGADKSISNSLGQLPMDLATDDTILKVVGMKKAKSDCCLLC